MRRSELIMVGLLMAMLIPLEILSAYLAYETLGEIISTLYFLVLSVNLLFLILAWRYPAWAAAGVIILALAIIPYQLLLGYRLFRAQAEAARIVVYAYEYKLKSGAYPADLSDYVFHDPEIKPYIQEYQRDDPTGGFRLAYYVGTRSTSHTFSPQAGWQYYPD